MLRNDIPHVICSLSTLLSFGLAFVASSFLRYGMQPYWITLGIIDITRMSGDTHRFYSIIMGVKIKKVYIHTYDSSGLIAHIVFAVIAGIIPILCQYLLETSSDICVSLYTDPVNVD
jgi:hypothetical protein